MTLARVWRRQLYRASGAALIVPCAMLAALLVLALGGGFGRVGVLGQLFSGPALPGAGSSGTASVAASGGHGSAGALPFLPAARTIAFRPATSRGAPTPTAGRGGGAGPGAGAGPRGGGGLRTTGGAIGPTGGTVTQGTGGGSGGGPPANSPPGSSAPQPTPQPSPPPPPRPTPVDTVVKVVTSVTDQVPAPAGPVATQVVQSAGAAVDNLVPQTGVP